jgi:RES domain-containing protein
VATPAHPKFDAIKHELEKLSKHRQPFSGIGYRCVEPKFAAEVLCGLGSRLHGGRWNPKGGFPTVYVSDSPEAALQEYLARARRMKLPDHRCLPMQMVGIRIKVANILDVTDSKIDAVVKPILVTEKIHWRAVQSKREAVSQAIGRALYEIGFAGLITSSQALAGGKTIVIFPEKLRATDTLKPLPPKPAE